MRDSKDFIIENRVLTKYCGKGGDVVIPDGVVSIGDWSFKDYRSLKSIELPDSLTSIGNRAFDGCSSLTKIVLPDSLTSIGDFAFQDCSSLTSITIPNGVVSVGAWTFDGCSSLKSIELPDSLTSIDHRAFDGCSSLTKIVLPDSLTSIGNGAFEDCSSLTSIVLPNNITFIGERLFEGCSSLRYNEKDGLKYLGSAVNPYMYLGGAINDGLDSVVINEHCKIIGDFAFEDCSSLTSITIPNSVISIGQSTFRGCSSLTSIVIPDSVTSIKSSSFAYCSSLTSITIPNSVVSIQDWAFEDCSSLTSITIPNSVVSVGDWAFNGCGSLKSIELPDSLTSIGNRAFDGCSSLTKIVLPDSLTSIGNGAFDGCSSLRYNEKDGLKYLGSAVNPYMYLDGLINQGIANVVISDYCKIIGDSAVESFWWLKSIVIGRNIEKINVAKLSQQTSITITSKDTKIEGLNVKREMKEILLPVGYCKERKQISSLLIPYFKDLDAEDYAFLWLYQSGKSWDNWFSTIKFAVNDVLKAIIKVGLEDEIIQRNIVKKIDTFIHKYSNEISEETQEEVRRALISKDDIAKLMVKVHTQKTTKEKKKQKEMQLRNTIPLEKYILENPNLTFPKELDSVKEGVKYKNHELVSSAEVVKFLLQDYLGIWERNKEIYYGEMSTGYKLATIRRLEKPERADKIACELDSSELVHLLERLVYGTNYRYFCIPYARFATEESMKVCLQEISHKKKGNAKDKYWAANLSEAIYYSDTKAAAEYIEKNGDIARYARLRGYSLQEWRDSVSLPDFGFDTSGVKKYVVDGMTLVVKINKNFELYITEEITGENIKSIPKKTEEGVKAAEDYATLKKEISAFYKQRKEYFKCIYITGEKISEKIWDQTYMTNPLFTPIVESLIWCDSNGVLFEVKNSECFAVNGEKMIPKGSISIAHVLDMDRDSIEKWQSRLVQEKKSLLIEQVWEPVCVKLSNDEIRDRYRGVVLTREERNELKRVLKAKAIEVKSEAQVAEYDHRAMKYVFSSEGTLQIGRVLRLDYFVDEKTDKTTLYSFRPFRISPGENREVNSIIFELDRLSVKSFIRQDKVEKLTENMLKPFTMAQISEFIDLSSKSGSVNCTAKLLNYKNERFGGMDILDGFIL